MSSRSFSSYCSCWTSCVVPFHRQFYLDKVNNNPENLIKFPFFLFSSLLHHFDFWLSIFLLSNSVRTKKPTNHAYNPHLKGSQWKSKLNWTHTHSLKTVLGYRLIVSNNLNNKKINSNFTILGAYLFIKVFLFISYSFIYPLFRLSFHCVQSHFPHVIRWHKEEFRPLDPSDKLSLSQSSSRAAFSISHWTRKIYIWIFWYLRYI